MCWIQKVVLMLALVFLFRPDTSHAQSEFQFFDRPPEFLMDAIDGLAGDFRQVWEMAGIDKFCDFMRGVEAEQERWITDNSQKTKETYDAVGVGIGLLSEEICGWTPIEVREVPGGYEVTGWFGMGPIPGKAYVVAPHEAALTLLAGPSAALFGSMKKKALGPALSSLDDLLDLERNLQAGRIPLTPTTPRTQPRMHLPDTPSTPVRNPVEPSGGAARTFEELPRTPDAFSQRQPGVLRTGRSVDDIGELDGFEDFNRFARGDKDFPDEMFNNPTRSPFEFGQPGTRQDVEDALSFWDDTENSIRMAKELDFPEMVEELETEKGIRMINELNGIAKQLLDERGGKPVYPKEDFLEWLKKHNLKVELDSNGHSKIVPATHGVILPIPATSNFQPAEETTYPVDPGDEDALKTYYQQVFY